ncbi:MAG TPA: hypothetical protein PL082_05265 [Tepidiformaceae bacterium]|nr:hypothetical protein [Tepidiformaceae bacterium]
MMQSRIRLHAVVRWCALAVVCGLIAAAGQVRPSAAADPPARAWTGAGANDLWTNPANWDTGAPNPGDSLLFPFGASRTINVNDYPEGTGFHRITFSGGGYTISGNRLSLADGLIHQGPGGLPNTVDLRIAGAGGITITSGGLYLNGDNLHFGATLIQGGGVVAGSDFAFGQDTAPVTVSSGSIHLDPNVEIANSLTIGGPGNPEVFGRDGSAWDGVIQTVAGDASFSAEYGATLELSTGVSGPATIHKLGGGRVLLSGVNTFSGKVHVEDGILEVTRDESLGGSQQGTIVHDGGTLRIAADFILEPIELHGPGDEDGGGALSHEMGINHLGNVTVADDTTIHANGNILRLTNGLKQSGAGHTVTKTGNHMLEIEGTSTFAGVVDLQEGTLSVRSVFPGSIEVNGGVLSGNGTCGPVTVHTGILVPGVVGVGMLTIDGDLQVDQTGQVEFTVDSVDSKSTLQVLGSVEIEGTPPLGVGGTGNVPVGTSVVLIQNDGPNAISGSFSTGHEQLAVAGSHVFETSYLGGNGNDLTITRIEVTSPDLTASVTPVPEVLAAGAQVSITYLARNDGPGTAYEVGLVISGGAQLQFVSVTVAPGWQCTPPAVGVAGPILCFRNKMAPGVDHVFVGTFTVAAVAGQSVTFGTAIEYEGTDPDLTNNGVAITKQVSGADSRPFRRTLPGIASDGGG